MRKTLNIGKVAWSYLDNEQGDELWIAFHGYGQEAEVMFHFMKSLQPNARILSFDLPFHGSTKVDANFLLTSDISELVGSLLREHKTQKCSLAGFSLGGKIVLKLVELVPGKIDRILLIAPDGLKINPMYAFVTNTFVGRLCFQIVIHFPKPFQVISWGLATLKLLHPKIHQFVTNQMGTKAKRQKVFDTWQMFKRIKPILPEIRSKIHRYHIRPTLIFGTKDKVINSKLAKKLSGNNCPTANVIMLNAGHRLTTKEHAEHLREMVD